ncbi:hypothetical protein ACIBP6_38650 [Nonomuraea terrae]|uniref:hypothetical protein n=1 Tax=Nonomuraea terrae TaxID=2530383 RepID=UPI003789FDFA
MAIVDGVRLEQQHRSRFAPAIDACAQAEDAVTVPLVELREQRVKRESQRGLCLREVFRGDNGWEFRAAGGGSRRDSGQKITKSFTSWTMRVTLS